VVPNSPTPRRVRTPNWLDLRLVAGVVLVAVSVAVGVLVVANSGKTNRVWAVSHDLDAGSVLTAADLAPAKVRLAHSDRLYVPTSGGVIGKRLNRPLRAGELLPRAVLANPAPAMTMTVPLTTDQAPKIDRGQKITFWVSTKKCQARVVVAGVTVLEVDSGGGGSFGTSSAENVVVRLGPDDAARVITALDLDGAVVRAGVVTGDSRPTSALQDLSACGAAS
jgi:SAF domain-containing protein